MSLFDSDDPRDRPRDPAGTQPKVDPETLHLDADRPDPSREQVDAELGEAIDRLEELEDEAKGAEPAPTTARFQFLWGALLAVGLIAVAGVVVVLVAGREEDAPKVAWSAWAPAAGDPLGQIAEHVGPQYRLADGTQLALITGSQLAYESQLATPVLADRTGSVSAIPGITVGYTLCGSGPGCTFPGKPTKTRGLLVRREALELAMYTLHYVQEADNVAVLLPKAKGKKTTTTLFFSRSGLARELAQPVLRTLSAITPTLKDVAASPDSKLVDALTYPAFDGHFTTNQTAQLLLVLEPQGG
jgi:hypothetical protein